MTKDYEINEANRCILCKNPRCKTNCPVSTMIPEIIELYRENKLEEAGKILFDNNPLSLICSIVCPHEEFCRGNCILGIKGEPIDFPAIEKEISSKYLDNSAFTQKEKLDKRVAVIGSGPSGIALAFILARKGYKITIFERDSKLGGVLRYGIPKYRLSKDILDTLENRLIDLGVKIRYNDLIGPVNNVENLLRDGYDAIFIGTGVWNPRPLSIIGETLGHVHYAINYLKSPETFRLGEKIVVIGAGNVAMDAARTAKRNGANTVTVVYRRGHEDMKATNFEIEEAIHDGVEFAYYNSPVKIVDEGIIVEKTENITNEDGSKTLKTVKDSEYLFNCDSIIIAVSQDPSDNIVSRTKEDIQVDRWGLVKIDEEGHTTREGIFASGDVVTGAKTVVEAVADTKKVAEAIDRYCTNK